MAWEISKTTNGIVINREVSDEVTHTPAIQIYWDYKGGDSWHNSFGPALASSYNSNRYLPTWNTAMDSFEFDLEPGHRLQMVNLSGGSLPGPVRMVVINEPLRVDVSNTPTVTVGNPLTQVSVSADSTLPVSLGSLGVVLEDTAIGFVVVGTLLSFVLGVLVALKSGGY